MTNQETTPDGIDELLTAISDTDWSIEDWSYHTGKFDNPTVSIQVEYQNTPRSGVDTAELLELVDRLEGDEGAPIDKVREKLEDEAALTEALNRGELYEPRDGTVRRT